MLYCYKTPFDMFSLSRGDVLHRPPDTRSEARRAPYPLTHGEQWAGCSALCHQTSGSCCCGNLRLQEEETSRGTLKWHRAGSCSGGWCGAGVRHLPCLQHCSPAIPRGLCSSSLRAALPQQQVLSCLSSTQACCVHPISSGSTKPGTQKQMVELFFLPNCPHRHATSQGDCTYNSVCFISRCSHVQMYAHMHFHLKQNLEFHQTGWCLGDKCAAVCRCAHIMHPALGCTSEPSLCPAVCPPWVPSRGLQRAPSPPARRHSAATAAPSCPPSPSSAQPRLWVPAMPARPPLLPGDSCAMLGMAGHGHFEYLVELLEWGKVGTRLLGAGWSVHGGFLLTAACSPFPLLFHSIPFYF